MERAFLFIGMFILVAALVWLTAPLGDPETGAGSRVDYPEES